MDPRGVTGDAAGPHYQSDQDPRTASVDPAYPNPQNEIWLDLTTDDLGNGSATSVKESAFSAERRPGSIVVHETATKTDPGVAGTAGERRACIYFASDAIRQSTDAALAPSCLASEPPSSQE